MTRSGVLVRVVTVCKICGSKDHTSQDCPWWKREGCKWCRFCKEWVKHTSEKCWHNPNRGSSRGGGGRSGGTTNSYAKALELDAHFNSDAPKGKYCTRCGKKASGAQNFCGGCGTQL